MSTRPATDAVDVIAAAQRIFEEFLGGPMDWFKVTEGGDPAEILASADWSTAMRYARAAIAAAPAPEGEWKPIKTAPKDWNNILLFDPKYVSDWQNVFEGFFDVEEDLWRDRQCAPVNPTHWQPLPAPPAR